MHELRGMDKGNSEVQEVSERNTKRNINRKDNLQELQEESITEQKTEFPLGSVHIFP